MPNINKNIQKILSRCKGLPKQLQAGEEPVLAIPAIWHSSTHAHSEACEVILTNQRLIGFYCKRFPSEKLFFDALHLSDITHVTLRQQTYKPVFRELLVSAGMLNVSLRAPRQQSEVLYSALRTATTTPHHEHDEQGSRGEKPEVSAASASSQPAPLYRREAVRTAFDTSPLAIMLLFVSGIVLEIVGAILWLLTQSSQVGLPLCGAGFVAVMVAIVQARHRS